MELSESSVSSSGYLNVLVNSQWRTCWCLIKNGQLWFYQDKGKNKVSQPAVTLEGCSVSPDPSPEHLYSFTIEMDGTQLATLEVEHRCSSRVGLVGGEPVGIEVVCQRTSTLTRRDCSFSAWINAALFYNIRIFGF